jgi:hypothetical protein
MAPRAFFAPARRRAAVSPDRSRGRLDRPWVTSSHWRRASMRARQAS